MRTLLQIVKADHWSYARFLKLSERVIKAGRKRNRKAPGLCVNQNILIMTRRRKALDLRFLFYYKPIL